MTASSPPPEPWRLAYPGKRVLVTGHTGFKGGWLTLWLSELGAHVTGYALAPPTTPSLFDAADVGGVCEDVRGDVRDLDSVRRVLRRARPDVVFHLASQPLVRRSYEAPLDTITTNVTGTATVLEAIRLEGIAPAIVVVTSDKCYAPDPFGRAFREEDPMGGRDVYSASKGAAELVVASYRASFFGAGPRVATARAGNVVGGGDWASDRIVPDIVRALVRGEAIGVRQPEAVRPWQHVLDPLEGYLRLGARLTADDGADDAAAFNFGPPSGDAVPVRRLVELFVEAWGGGTWEDRSDPAAPHEEPTLALDATKARARLGWQPSTDLRACVARTAAWYRAYYASNRGRGGMRDLCLKEIRERSGAG